MTIKVIIIEDEQLAVGRLKRLLTEIEGDFEVIKEIKSVSDGLHWFNVADTTLADLIFSDIQLLDGLAFEIFEKNNITTPIIFTTAFDQYLLKAFKTYGIEYLLKPFSGDDLAAAIKKFKTWKKYDEKPAYITEAVLQSFIKGMEQPLWPTFIAYVKDKILPVQSEDVVYFSLSYQAVYAYTHDRKKWPLQESLNQIQEKLPNAHFYRANRQILVQRKFIKEIANYFGGRLKLQLTIEHEEILISKDNVKHFKDWLQS